MGLSIAFYTDSYLPATDGVVSSILNFKKGLEAKGHDVYIFASSKISARKPRSRSLFLYPGIDFRPYPQYSMALFPYNSISKLKELGIDIVHAHTPLVMGFAGMISAKIGRYPIVGSYHTLVNNRAIIKDYYPKNEQLRRLTTRYLMRYIKFFYRRCNATTVPSRVIKRRLDNYGGIENIVVVPNSVDQEIFNSRVSGSEVRRRLGIKEREKIVLYVGRMSKEKRIEVMLKAAKIISKRRSDVRFVIAGTGPASNHYKAIARSLGLHNVRFIGYVEKKELPKVYAASDLFCLPSTFETQGIVSLEAMATGKPVVCADYLALSELVKNGKNGEKFRPGDYEGCALKIEKVLNNPGSYISGALNTSKEFSVEKVTNKLIDVYGLVLAT